MCHPILLEMKNKLPLVLSDLFRLLFPSLCLGCHQELSSSNRVVCISCELQLPLAYHSKRVNLLLPLADEHIPAIQTTFSLFLFEEDSVIEKMLYQLKYKNNRRIGRFFSQKLGGYIREKGMVFDGILGVPLHRKRLQKRGYNQVDIIGNKLSEVLNIPYFGNRIQRIKNTPPLSKVKTNRKTLLVDAFRCLSPAILPQGHYLLLDDIYTTGSTLSACIEVLLAKEKITLSIATVALRI